ncbi:GNAT family N-acetyltransferase [uncultured Shewanella sp.]|uniref:GNAT family N-acetyltransferase n=1 Tax=uncultured Shewanella sp. TaxID=173975 RepID=UPI0026160E2B|nr:GNAT family N-acetyltransferase [uncultured Shewanella sp.]
MTHLDIQQYSKLPITEKSLQQAHIQDTFGHIPFVKQRQWAQPDMSYSLKEGNELLAFFHIVLRNIEVDGTCIPVAGLSNLITPEQHRGKGHANALLTQGFSAIFSQLNAQHSLLLCKDELIPFYQQLNWYIINTQVVFMQKQGTEYYHSNTLMLSAGAPLNPTNIDLKGLPW